MSSEPALHKSWAAVTGPERPLPEPGLTLYVAPGASSGDGSVERPFGSIVEARDRVRAIKAGAGLPAGGARIVLRGGDYFIGSTVRFDERDSGRPGEPVVYAAYAGEKPILHGAALIDGASFGPAPQETRQRLAPRAAEHVRCADLSGLAISADDMELHGFGSAYRGDDSLNRTPTGGTSWNQLYVDGELQQLARYPNVDDGYVRTGAILESEGLVEPGPVEGGVFEYTDARPERWASTDNVWIHGNWFFDWADAAVRLEALDTAKKTITFSQPIAYGLKPGMRYCYLNVLEELDAPGEWYLDRDRKLLYYYPKDDLTNADIRFPLVREHLIETAGASYLTFASLSIGYCRSTPVKICGGRDVALEGCTIRNCGGKAVIVGSYPDLSTEAKAGGGINHRVESCDISWCGFGGIHVGTGDRRTLEPCGVEIVNNDIHHFSCTCKMYTGGISLDSVGAHVANNRLHDVQHTAVFLKGNDNVIEYNEIYNCVQESDDAGAFYCGRDFTLQGNVVRYNFFHHLKSDAETGVSVFGTYTDDCSAGVAIYGNIYYKVQDAHLSHGAQDILFENNLIVESWGRSKHSVRFVLYGYPRTFDREKGQHYRYLREVPHDGPVWRARYSRMRTYTAWAPEEQRIPHYCSVRNNVLIGHVPMHFNFSMEEHGNQYTGNLSSDEMLGIPDAERLDFAIPKDAPIYEQAPGFRPIPFERIGLYRDRFRTYGNENPRDTAHPHDDMSGSVQ